MKRIRELEVDEELPQAKRSKLDLGKWDKCIQELGEYFEQVEAIADEANEVIPLSMYNVSSDTDAKFDIERRITILRKTFHNGFSPSPVQIQIFNLIMTVNMRWIVGDRYEMYKPLILNELQLSEIKVDLHFILSRQQGKTTVVAHAVKSFGIHIPRRIAVFSTGTRTSQALLSITKDAVRSTLGDQYKEHMLQENATTLKMKVITLESSVTHAQYSHVTAYPSSGASKFVMCCRHARE